jgi:hypothetical protein
MIKVNIDVSKINKERIRIGKSGKGKYLDLILMDKPSDKGDDGFVVEGVTKEEREQNIRGNIIGNWKYLQGKPKPSPTASTHGGDRQPIEDNDGEEIPF